MDEETQALLDMSVGNTLALAVLVKVLVENCLIDRAALVDAMDDQRVRMNEGQAWPIETLMRTLDTPRRPKLVLVQ